MLENGPEIDARQRKREDIGRLTMTNEVLIRHRFPDRSEQGETSPFFMPQVVNAKHLQILISKVRNGNTMTPVTQCSSVPRRIQFPTHC